MFKFKLKGQLVVLLLLLSLISILFVGDFKVRLANSGDWYNCVDFAYFLQDPARFKNDAISTYGHFFGASSIQYWLPALLLRTMHIPPEILTWFFTYLQNVLLGFALFYYASVVTGRRDIAWVTVFFAFTALPWRWNLANYENMMSFPYYGQLVLPFLIFAAAELIKGHAFRVVCLLVFSALIQASLTLQTAVIIGGFWLLRYGFSEGKILLRRILSLGIVITACLVPLLNSRFKYPDQLSVSELMSAVRKFYHFNPPILGLFWAYRLPTFLGFIGLTTLAFRGNKGLHASFIRFWLACLGAIILFAFVYMAGLIWGIPPLLQLVPLRSTALMIIFSLPLVIAYLIEKLESGKFMMCWITASLLFLHAFFSFGVFWGIILALVLSDLSQGRLSVIKLDIRNPLANWLRRASSIIFVAWLGLIIIFGAYAVLGGPQVSSRPPFSILIPGGQINARGFLFAIFAALAVGLIGMKQPLKMRLEYSLTKLALIAMLISLTIFKAYQCGRETAQPLARANYAAQVWARDNTAQDALFIVTLKGKGDDIPWRTVSRRPVTSPYEHFFVYIYTGSRSAKKLDEEMELFLNQDSSYKNKKRLSEAGILRWAKRFGGDYVVTSTSEPFKFPEVYRNSCIIIYKLPLS